MTASVIITYELSASLCSSLPQPSPQGYRARRGLVQPRMAYTGCYEVGRHCIGGVHSGSWAAWHQCSAQTCTQGQRVQQNSEPRGPPALQMRSQSPRDTALQTLRSGTAFGHELFTRKSTRGSSRLLPVG